VILALLALACAPSLKPGFGAAGSVYRNQRCVDSLPHDTRRAPGLAEGRVMVEVIGAEELRGALGAELEGYGPRYWLVRSTLQVEQAPLDDLGLKVELNRGGEHFDRCSDCDTARLATLLQEVQIEESPERVAARRHNSRVGAARFFTGVLSGGILLGLVPKRLYKDVPDAEVTYGGDATARLEALISPEECLAQPGWTCDEGTLLSTSHGYDPSIFRTDELQLHLEHRQGEGSWIASCRITEVLRLRLPAAASLPEQVAALFPDGPRSLADLREEGVFD
jgi:hypothetical protein